MANKRFFPDCLIWLKQLGLGVLCFLIGLILGFGADEVGHRFDYLWCPQDRSPDSITPPFNFGLEAIKHQPAAVARKKLQGWLQRYPESWKIPEIALAWQELALLGGNRDAACRYLSTARRKWKDSPQFAFWAVRWSEVLLRHGEKDSARQILQELVAKNNWGRPEGLRLLGTLAATESKWLRARSYWGQLLATFPDSAAAHEVEGPLALLRVEAGEVVGDAVKIRAAQHLVQRKLFDRALTILAPANSEALTYQRLQILLQARRYSLAVSAARSFLAGYPQSCHYDEVLRRLARILAVATRQPEQAIVCYRSLLDRVADRRRQAVIYLALGDCYVARGQDQQALDAYRQAARSGDTEHLQQTAYFSLANVCQRRGETASTIAYLELAAQHLHGRHILAITRKLARLYQKNGQGHQALALWERLLSREWNDDNRRQILIAAIQAAIKLGNQRKARDYLQQARQAIPANSSQRRQLQKLEQELASIRKS